MTQSKYTLKARKFVRSIIRQRKQLLRMEKSYKNQALCRSYITELEKYLNFYAYSKAEQMAIFMIHYYPELKFLLPNYQTHTLRHIKLDQLVREAKNILKNGANISFDKPADHRSADIPKSN